MKQILSDNDRNLLDIRIAEAEKQTKVQIVLATVKRTDNYLEIPWKAFALGASVAGFLVFLLDIIDPGRLKVAVALFYPALILASGGVFALMTIFSPAFARLFLSGNHSETEARQYAESLFLSRELYATEGRRSILLLISEFERQVVIIPDKGVRDRLSIDVMNNIVLKMTENLKKKEARKAMESGLDELIAVLSPTNTSGYFRNELPNEIIEEGGL